MLGLYTFLLRVFVGISPLLAGRNGKLGRWLAGQKRWRSDLTQHAFQGKVIWFHCASVGEFEQARPVMEMLKARKEGLSIAVTFFSPSGFDALKDHPLPDFITYLPVDLPKNVATFLDAMKPAAAIFVKYELWFNFMDALHRRKVPMALISAFFPGKHWTVTWPGIHLGMRLKQFDRIFTQDDTSCSVLGSIGIYNGVSVGDTRVDRVLAGKEAAFHHEGIAAFTKRGRVVLIGSNWPGDDELLMSVLKKDASITAMVVPHELHTSQQERWKRVFGGEMLTIDEAEQVGVGGQRILYVNRIGLLSRLYRYAAVAYVGGGFGRAVHNTLEAAVYGIPVIFGPNNKRFLEIQQLKAMDCGTEIKDAEQLEQALQRALDDEAYRQDVRLKLARYFEEQRGAAEKIALWIEALL